MANKLMDSVLENSINQGLKNNLNNALSDTGVKVSSKVGLWQYPEIIRNKMAVNTINGINITGNDCIKISYTVDNDIMNYEISTVLDTYDLNRPDWAGYNGKWGKKLNIQNIFDDLFSNILPKIRGVYAGDVTSTTYEGDDTTDWNNEYFGVTGHKNGLKPSSQYLRLYLTSQHEPIYICMKSYIEDITGGYNVENSDTVDFIINDKTQKLSAHINVISNEQLKSIGVN